MNCLIYLRVSTKEQAEGGYSIPAQREACVKYIADKGWNLVGEFADCGESARSVDRPELQEMLSKVKSDESIDAVVVHKLDRLARNIEDHAGIRAMFRNNEVQLISVSENLEDSASGKLVEGILAAIAEFYSANLSGEVKKGMREKVRQGGWPNQAPFGYRNVRGKDGTATIAVTTEQAEVVREAFSLYATGEYSITELHEKITANGVAGKYGKPIARAHLARVLHNQFYTGRFIWQEQEYQGNYEPLVSQETFDRVQDIFALHDKAGERKRKHPHYLKGTLYCGECGARLSVQIAKNKYAYFYCLGQVKKNGCKQAYIGIPEVEQGIIKLYRDIQLPPAFIQKLRAKLQKELEDRESFNLKKRTRLEKRLEKLSNERGKLLQAYYSEAIPLDLLKEEQKRITCETKACESELAKVGAKFEIMEATINKAINLATDCAAAYEAAPPQVRRMFNQAFFEKIFVTEKKVSGFDYTEPFDLLIKRSRSNKDHLAEGVGFEPAEHLSMINGFQVLSGSCRPVRLVCMTILTTSMSGGRGSPQSGYRGSASMGPVTSVTTLKPSASSGIFDLSPGESFSR